MRTGRHARVLETYRALARLRREQPDLTDPSFGSVSCTADEQSRLFTMRRGDLLVVVNFGAEATRLATSADRVLFATGDDVALRAGELVLPAHAGAVVGPVSTTRSRG